MPDKKKTLPPLEPPALRPMLRLGIAAKLVYRRTSRRKAPDDDTLKRAARMIAARTRIFTCGPTGDESPALVMPDELFEGQFVDAGELLTFKDGRPPIGSLCILHAELDHVIDDIGKLYAAD
jgi:hypothetical protein